MAAILRFDFEIRSSEKKKKKTTRSQMAVSYENILKDETPFAVDAYI